MIMMIPGKPFYVVNGFCDACRTLGGRTTQFSWWWQLDRDVYEDDDDDGDDEDIDDKDDDEDEDRYDICHIFYTSNLFNIYNFTRRKRVNRDIFSPLI